MSDLILVLNCGSSSIKFALFDAGAQPLPRQPLWNGKVDGITGPAPTFGETGVTPCPVALDAAHPYHAALQHIRSKPLPDPIPPQNPVSYQQRIVSAFYPPHFATPFMIDQSRIDAGMDAGVYTFALVIPPNFQRDVLAGRDAQLQLNTDATRMTQAFSGSGYVQQIVTAEISEFVNRYRGTSTPAVRLEQRARFNPALDKSWFGALSQIINHITMLSIILAGAALIREREHGTVEHLLVMPVTPTEIMLGKIWSMALVVLVASAVSLNLVVRWALDVPVAGSLPLFYCGAALLLFATTSLGIFLATVARNMPQFGMLVVLVLLPMQMLSGGNTPRESMPELVQTIMLAAPTTHFVELGQAILYRGAGIEVVWKPFLFLLVIGAVLFSLSLTRFRKTISQMA